MHQRRLSAIMFTDLVGFTSMMAKNEQETLQVLEKIRHNLKSLVEEHNGKWQKEIGDGTLSSFNSAVDAVYCAQDFQKAIRNENFKIRIGIHVGEVTLTEDDIFGDGVNIAARIEPLSQPGGICITDRVYEDISNKPEFETAFLGERVLKNVDRPIKIYTMVGEGLPDPPGHKTFNSINTYIKDLLKRRVPQVGALYILISFAIVQIVQWILDMHMLSPHWLDFTWILLLSLLPSIALISYYHGKSGMDKWVRTEKIFIPLNFVAAAITLFFLFQGKDLGATTREIIVEDEEGNTAQRIIPKNEFIKDVAIFDFENNTNDENLAWLSYGISHLLQNDLYQDLFINTGLSEQFYKEFTIGKIKRGERVPFELKRDIAKHFRFDFFVSGNYDKNENGFILNLHLFKTNNGSQVASHTLEGDDLFDLADQLSVTIKKDLQLPTSYIEKTEDLPVSSILTSNLEAYENYTKALILTVFENDWEGSIKYLLKSIESDPDFMLGYFNLANSYFWNNQIDEATIYIDKIMNKLYMFPERDRFDVKWLYYTINADDEAKIRLQEMLVSLYPNDVLAVWFLATDYQYYGEYTKAEALIKSTLEFDDYRGELYVTLAEILLAQDKKEEALSYYQLYTEKYPDHSRSYQLLGDYYFEDKKFEEAKLNYEKSLILATDNTKSLTKLALIKELNGLFEDAEMDYNSALKFSHSPFDSMDIYNNQMDYFRNRGLIQKAIKTKEQFLITAQNVYPPAHVSILRLTGLTKYYLINQSERALELIKREEKNLGSLYGSIVVSIAYIEFYIYQKDIQKLEYELENLHRDMKSQGLPGGFLKYYNGEVFYIKDEFLSAIQKYQEYKEEPNYRDESTQSLKIAIDIRIALCFLKLDRKSDAKNQLNSILELNPYHAEANLLMAKIFLDQNKNSEAKKHLIIASKVWENADDDYEMAQEAKKLLRELDDV